MSVKYSIEEREHIATQWIAAFEHLTSEHATKSEILEEHVNIKNFLMICGDGEVARRIECLNNFSSGQFYFGEDDD